MDSKYIIGIIVAIIIIAGALLAFSGSSSQQKIEIAGSTSVQPVAEKLAQAYMQKHPDVKINVQGGGSSVGITSVQKGQADIGMSSKELKADEKAGLNEYLVGKDGIVIAVNTKNSVSDLKVEQVKDIFSGKISNWKEVGGQDAKINVITREDGSGTRKAFEEIIMGKDTKIIKEAVVQSSTEAVAQSIKGDPNAIGYISLASLSSDVKSLSINGVAPSEQTVSDGTYKIQRPFLFLTKGEPKGAVKDFIDFCLSPEGQAIVKGEKVVPAK
ncbi:phosphate ABC transporter substrate-binding protein [Methanobacterium sp. ACI-7]|uniref:phosphate ABC transporter substrate-binding protein n=1 Tax=unclassified Methanobacterium TaxID=2627676 RepID=UPI0039C013EE